MNCLVCQTPTQSKGGHQWCPQCGLIKLNAPLNHDLNDYVKGYRALFDTDLEIRINMGRLATIMKFVPLHKRIMDWGCSCGNFIARAEKYYECVGYEPATLASAYRTCTSNIVGDVDRISGKFDVITMFDVIEHFDNPRPALTYIVSLLNVGSKLVIMTPDPHHFIDNLAGFYHLKPGEHAYMWSLDSLTRIMKEMGMDRIYYNYDEGIMRKNSGGTGDLLASVFEKK